MVDGVVTVGGGGEDRPEREAGRAEPAHRLTAVFGSGRLPEERSPPVLEGTDGAPSVQRDGVERPVQAAELLVMFIERHRDGLDPEPGQHRFGSGRTRRGYQGGRLRPEDRF